MILPSQSNPSPWPRRIAVALACATFPLIWVGGLVTTYDAGMAVPDWPNTYGYNLFLYPWTTWLAGTFDVFIEHGHRLLGALVGLLALVLAVVVWRTDHSRGLRVATLIAVAAVILQGVLGGLRVRLNERWLAQVHGCFAPAFFAFTCGLALATTGCWRQVQAGHHPRGAQVRRMALATLLLAYLQIVLGSFLRHAAADLPPDQFRLAVWLHVAVACALLAHAAWLARLGFAVRRCRAIRRPLSLVPGRAGWGATWLGGRRVVCQFRLAGGAARAGLGSRPTSSSRADSGRPR